MKVVVAASVIPERRETFLVVLRSLLGEQQRRVNRLDVYLKGSADIPDTFPKDGRIHYISDLLDSGPWSRYLSANGLDSGDILVTVDDDTWYPPDFIAKGVAELMGAGLGHAVTYAGMLWDPTADVSEFTKNNWRYYIGEACDRHRAVAIPFGLCSFFHADTVRDSVRLPLAGLHTNDDMMIAYCLQKRGIAIVCPPRPAGWIRHLPIAYAPHALGRRDASGRIRTFRELVRTLGFDPTAGQLQRYLEKPRRVLVLADALPPLAGTDDLDEQLTRLCTSDTSVHVLGPVGNSAVPTVMFRASAPYEVHAVAVPECGGRLDSVPPVRAWRNWRVQRATTRRRANRERLARERLRPTEMYRYHDGRLHPVQLC